MTQLKVLEQSNARNKMSSSRRTHADRNAHSYRGALKHAVRACEEYKQLCILTDAIFKPGVVTDLTKGKTEKQQPH